MLSFFWKNYGRVYFQRKEESEAFSDVKDAAIKFVVDRTAPTISVTGMKNNGRYQTDRQVVTIAPTDDGGMLKSLIIRTVDEDGNVIEELVNLSEDKLAEALAIGNITFELGEALYQNVQIICEDYAGNITGSESGELYENISVSSSAFMIFWANKALRWGTIAGIVVLLALGSFLIVLKKRKKDEEQSLFTCSDNNGCREFISATIISHKKRMRVMKMNKRIITILLVAIMTVSLVVCSNSDTENKVDNKILESLPEGIAFVEAESVELGTPDLKRDPQTIYDNLTYIPEMFYGE